MPDSHRKCKKRFKKFRITWLTIDGRIIAFAIFDHKYGFSKSSDNDVNGQNYVMLIYF
jgi:hypothetical protein